MSEEKLEEDNKEESSKGRKQRGRRMTQGQIIQNALGLNPTDIEEVEKKLFIVRFLDFFSEDTLEFIFKGRIMEQNVTRLATYMDSLQIEREEEILLKQAFESKNIINVIEKVKNQTEEFAVSKGIKANVNSRLRRLTLYITLPLFALLTILTFLPIGNLYYVFFPILCIVCILPQVIRGKVVKNWYQFKEQNKNQIYADNRDDLMIIKSFASELLDNIRSRLIELEIPLQLIKFTLFSRDYENLNLLNSRNIKGFMQYFYTFAYPPGMEEIPIPEKLQKYQQPIVQDKHIERPEKNFIVLTEMKGKDGIITSFVPTLKDLVADEINTMLNESEFNKAPNKFKSIIPNYSENLAIYCVCGELAKIESVQICNWKNQFKFYLFEASECNCGESVYALSLMDESTEVPEELKDIFSS
ncbi:MAG: hypothetical protein ACXACX_22810 [Candidatus Hodarchaeales archaeon]|jgi:hypothetical protein